MPFLIFILYKILKINPQQPFKHLIILLTCVCVCIYIYIMKNYSRFTIRVKLLKNHKFMSKIIKIEIPETKILIIFQITIFKKNNAKCIKFYIKILIPNDVTNVLSAFYW